MNEASKLLCNFRFHYGKTLRGLKFYSIYLNFGQPKEIALMHSVVVVLSPLRPRTLSSLRLDAIAIMDFSVKREHCSTPSATISRHEEARTVTDASEILEQPLKNAI